MTHTLKDQVQFDALTAIYNRDAAGLAVSMGMGKTRIGLKDMDRLLHEDLTLLLSTSPIFLVVVPGTAIKQSWIDEARDAGLEHLLPYIEFTTYLSLTKQGFDWRKVYCDECHSLKNKHYGWLYEYRQFHKGQILGVTGTKPRFVNSETGKLVNQFCPIVFEYITDEAVEAGLLNDYRILVHRVPLSTARDHKIEFKKKDGTTGSFVTSEKDNYDYWCTKLLEAKYPSDVERIRLQRMTAMKKWKSKERYMKFLSEQIPDKTLLFTNTKEQAQRQCAHQYFSGNPYNKVNLELFKKGDISRLACVQQLNQGVNIPGLKAGVIWHCYGNETQAAQKIGRFLRLNPTERATVHILMYENTVDEQWVEAGLRDFDQSKIFYLDSQLI